MHWQDEGYILSKSNYNENSIIIETFTLNHGKCAGIVYGGTSRKQKKNYQIGNKVFLNWKSKGENRVGYFNTELNLSRANIIMSNQLYLSGVNLICSRAQISPSHRTRPNSKVSEVL